MPLLRFSHRPRWVLPALAILVFPLAAAGKALLNPTVCVQPGDLGRALEALLSKGAAASPSRPATLQLDSVSVGERARFSPKNYPYASGTDTPDIPLPAPPGCEIRIPPTLETIDVDPATISISPSTQNERLRGAAEGEEAPFLAMGGISVVHKVSPPGKAAFVIKLVKEGMERALRRDIVMEWLVRRLSEGAFLRGERYVRVAKSLSSRAQRARGTLKLEFVEGLKADDLADAAARLRRGKPYHGDAELLRTAGLTLEEATERLAALEYFYVSTHADALRLHEKAALGGPARNYVNAYPTDINRALPVGLDYNHGQNVIWSPKERMFVIIDW